MYKIGIIGHTMEDIKNHKEDEKMVKNTIDLLAQQYSKDVSFNIAAETGLSEWAADHCIRTENNFHLFLPYPLKDAENMLFEYQFNSLKKFYNLAKSITISFPYYDKTQKLELQNYKNLIDNSQFLVVFWEGMRQGTVYEAINYALSTHKLLLDGHNKLTLMTNENL